MTEDFRYTFDAQTARTIAGRLLPEYYRDNTQGLISLWRTIAQYQILKECHDTNSKSYSSAEGCYQSAIDTLVEQITPLALPLNTREVQVKWLQAYAASFDPYSSYYPQENNSSTLNLAGQAHEFGIQLRKLPSGSIVVETVNPASNTGNDYLRPGDILLKVNGNAPKDISGHIGISDIYPTAQTLNITVQRKTNIFSVVITKSLHTSNTGRIYTRNLENDTILYLRIPHFYKPENKSSTSTMAEEVHAILTDWKNSAAGAEGLLIDLRQNIGGSVLAALELANIFIPKCVSLQIKT